MTQRRLNARQRVLWDMFDFSHGRGLEIGPLHNLSVSKEYADVAYIDVFDREQLIKNYSRNPKINPDKIPEIDHVLSHEGRVRSIPEAVGGREPFDWVMASHVIEHVPDVIGWLAQVAEITKDDGRLVLVVPDRRYCFDVHRPGTTVGQMLQAHELGETVPSVRAVFDYKRGHAGTKAPDVWAGKPPGYGKRIYSLDVVREQVDRARKGEYIDAHVWTFTPGTLVEQLIELRELGLSEWAIEKIRPTRHDQSQFFVVLRRLPRDGNWSPELFEAEPDLPEIPDWLQEWVDLRAELSQLRGRLQRRREQVKRLEGRLAKSEKQTRRLRRELDGLKASWRWRVGGALTRPAGVVRRARQR